MQQSQADGNEQVPFSFFLLLLLLLLHEVAGVAAVRDLRMVIFIMYKYQGIPAMDPQGDITDLTRYSRLNTVLIMGVHGQLKVDSVL